MKQSSGLRMVDLTVRFALELCALAALAYGGWLLPGPVWVRVPAAVVLPLAAAVIWGRWVAPRASRPLPDPMRLIPEWVVFGGAAAALVLTGHAALAGLLSVLAAVNRYRLRAGRSATAAE